MQFIVDATNSLHQFVVTHAGVVEVADWPPPALAAEVRQDWVSTLQGTLLKTEDGAVHVIGFGAVLRTSADETKVYTKGLTDPGPVLRDAVWFSTNVAAHLPG